MKIRFPGWLLLTLLTLFLPGCHTGGQHVVISADGKRVDVQVEVALSAEERQKGLMGREYLADGTGMLFVYGADTRPVMWMKDMLIPLDLVFIGEDLTINHIENSVPPCDSSAEKDCARYGSPYASSWVLELPAGYTGEHGVIPGNPVELIGIEGF